VNPMRTTIAHLLLLGLAFVPAAAAENYDPCMAGTPGCGTTTAGDCALEEGVSAEVVHLGPAPTCASAEATNDCYVSTSNEDGDFYGLGGHFCLHAGAGVQSGESSSAGVHTPTGA
jgi:hypothetical protein